MAEVTPSSDKHFAVISIQKVTEVCSVFQDIKSQMNENLKVLSAKFDKEAQQIRVKEKVLEQKKNLFESAAYSKELGELEKEKQNIQSEMEGDRQALQKVYFDAINELNKTMSTIIGDIENKNNYFATFESSTLIHSNLDDITDEVVSNMNKRVPKAKINFKADEKKNSK